MLSELLWLLDIPTLWGVIFNYSYLTFARFYSILMKSTGFLFNARRRLVIIIISHCYRCIHVDVEHACQDVLELNIKAIYKMCYTLWHNLYYYIIIYKLVLIYYNNTSVRLFYVHWIPMGRSIFLYRNTWRSFFFFLIFFPLMQYRGF